MIPQKYKNQWNMLLFTVLLGGFAGLVIWSFLKAVSLAAILVWESLPGLTAFKYLTVVLCTLGGLACGILHKLYGVYPEDLTLVMGKIKKEKYYDYRPLPVMLVSAFIPLVFGASVGPEAGLTGIIAALCYWAGDNLSFASDNTAIYSEIGEAVTLGHLFHSPLFGILAVEEDPLFEEKKTQKKDPSKMEGKRLRLSRSSKLLYYVLSTAASFLAIGVLNHLFGTAMSGFPSFSEAAISPQDYGMLILYIPAGCIAWLFYEYSEKITKAASAKIPMVLREALCGLVIGITGLLVPMLLFSGEEQMAELMESFGSYAPAFLICICFLKLLMTAFCIRFGMKGGHFFPLIFASVCLGMGLAMLVFPDPSNHAAFAAGAVTAVNLGAQLKKPIAVSLLLLLCFPVRLLFWIFLCAVIGGKISGLLHKKQVLPAA